MSVIGLGDFDHTANHVLANFLYRLDDDIGEFRKDTSRLPKLDPSPNSSSIDRIVGIGYDQTYLNNVVVPPRGTAVSIPSDYDEKLLDDVVKLFLNR
ncbi:unnamed protein product [Strongylus vulgaris]|uniref:Uncharacterized protein n=1 Tax=Strongylus vulgaris TaxID=40348 RepID=A0A3P7IFX7_STRVU|nr:unnamed protein product [Strongylus vulgaris]